MKSNKDDIFVFFEASVRENYRMLRSYYMAMSLSFESAEDLVQETFLTAFKLLHVFDRAKPLRPWLRGIAKNKYFELCRMKREIPVDGDTIEMIDAQYFYWENAFAEDADVYVFLKKCIDKLNAEDVKVIESFYYKNLSTREIADACGLREATVRKRLQRIRENLKCCMEKHA